LNQHLPAVVRHDSPALRQAKAKSTARLAAAIKRIEHVPSHLGGNSGAIVANGNFNPLRVSHLAPPNPDRNVPPFVNSFNRILDYGVQRDT
jgi:hypothetical protein